MSKTEKVLNGGLVIAREVAEVINANVVVTTYRHKKGTYTQNYVDVNNSNFKTATDSILKRAQVYRGKNSAYSDLNEVINADIVIAPDVNKIINATVVYLFQNDTFDTLKEMIGVAISVPKNKSVKEIIDQLNVDFVEPEEETFATHKPVLAEKVKSPIIDIQGKSKLNNNLVRVLEGKKPIRDDTIDITNDDSIIYYASIIQKKIFGYIDVVNARILEYRDQSNLSDYLSKVTEEIQEKSILKPPSFFAKLFKRKKVYDKEYYEKQIDEFKEYVKDVESALTQRLGLLDSYSKEIDKFKNHLLQHKEDFNKYKTRGKDYLENVARKTIEDTESKAVSDPSSNAAIELISLKNNLTQLEKKVQDLEVTSVTIEQLIVSIVVLDNVYSDIKGKISSVLSTIIPLFKISSMIQLTTESIDETSNTVNQINKDATKSYVKSVDNMKKSLENYNLVTGERVNDLVTAFNDLNDSIKKV